MCVRARARAHAQRVGVALFKSAWMCLGNIEDVSVNLEGGGLVGGPPPAATFSAVLL